VKAKILSVFMFVFAAVSVTAAMNVEKVWQPDGGLAPLRARMPFMQFMLSSDTTERVNGISVKTTGPSGERLVVQKGDGEIAGMEWIVLQGTATTTFIPLSLVVKAGEPEYLTLHVDRGQVMNSAYVGTVMTAEVVAVWTDTTVSGAFPITGARYTANSSLQIGRIESLSRVDGHQNITAGPNQVLGSIEIAVGASDGLKVYNLPVDFHVTGGDATRIRDLVVVDQNGALVARAWGPRIREQGSERVATFFFSGEKGDSIVFPPNTTTKLLFKGDTTYAFDHGGTLSLETDIARWRLYGVTYGYESAVSYYRSVMMATRFVRVPLLNISTMSPQYAEVQPGVAQVQSLQIVLDATQSSEDIRLQELPILMVTLPGWTTDISRPSFYDDTTLVGLDHRAIPFENGIARLAFHFLYVVVPKGTKKVLTMKIDIGPHAAGFYGIGLGGLTGVKAVGFQSGKTPKVFLVPGYTILNAVSTKG